MRFSLVLQLKEKRKNERRVARRRLESTYFPGPSCLTSSSMGELARSCRHGRFAEVGSVYPVPSRVLTLALGLWVSTWARMPRAPP